MTRWDPRIGDGTALMESSVVIMARNGKSAHNQHSTTVGTYLPPWQVNLGMTCQGSAPAFSGPEAQVPPTEAANGAQARHRMRQFQASPESHRGSPPPYLAPRGIPSQAQRLSQRAAQTFRMLGLITMDPDKRDRIVMSFRCHG